MHYLKKIRAFFKLMKQCVGQAARKSAQNPKEVALAAKAEKIREIYARARIKIQALKQERKTIIEDYAKKVDAARIKEARRRLKEL